MLSRFFIERPVFAAVISIVITIAGLVSIRTLPLMQYPEIAPPTVEVTCNYPGASATVVANTVASPIEQSVNGVEHMLYMSSQSNNDGSYSLSLTFSVGANIDIAMVQVQNRISQATPLLPREVVNSGVTVRKRSSSILLGVNLYSPDGRYDRLYLTNYSTIHVREELARIPGVGDVFTLNQQDYSMRIWLDPERLAERNITSTDVVAALREQNVQVAAGQIGQPPVPKGQEFQYVLTTTGRLVQADEFANIVIKTGSAGQLIRLKDVARIELGARRGDLESNLDGMPCATIGIFQLPGSNALETADLVKAKMEQLKSQFPQGLDYAIVYDTTPFIRESINELVHSLRDAVILVALVVILFLQSWRSALIPLTAVPVSLIGTFAVMSAFGYSINNLTLFGLVLAVGIVVDDAIVVVENVERWIARGLTPRAASYKAMEEVTVAVIAIAFGLSAIFIPTAFIAGISGQFYRQFALTIATSTLISALVSLTLSPALCALILQPHGRRKDIVARLLDGLFGRLFRGFNRLFERSTTWYSGAIRRTLRASAFAWLFYFGLLGLTYTGFQIVPTGFIPAQDKGYLLANVQLPDSASFERTTDVMERISKIARQTTGVKHAISISGLSFFMNANCSNFGSMFIILDEFDKRRDPALNADAIALELMKQCDGQIQEAMVVIVGAPPVDGFGRSGGFKIMIEDQGDHDLTVLQAHADNLVEKASRRPELAGLLSQFRAGVPQLFLDLDRTKCKTMGIDLNEVFTSLQVYLGGFYVNDFNRFGRTWQVNLQAEPRFRTRPEDLNQIKVRNAAGGMVPLGAIAQVREVSGPVLVTRYNMHTAAAISGAAMPGVSSGQMIAAVEKLAREELPATMSFEWTEITYLEILAASTAAFIFPLCVLFVFLTHSAEYESFSLPLGIILIVPMSLLCALFGIWLRGMDNNLLTQIGFVVLAGLACKNAVLIIEFAKQQHDKGMTPFEAAVEASRLRLRPIIMTSLAFILGVVPLVIAQGAGAELRRTLGTAVFAGMLGVTLFGIFLTPVFYFTIQRVVDRVKGAGVAGATVSVADDAGDADPASDSTH